MDTSVSGVRSTIYIGYLDYRGAFKTVIVLYCCIMGEHSRQRTVLNTSLSEAHGTIATLWCRRYGLISRLIIICKKVNKLEFSTRVGIIVDR